MTPDWNTLPMLGSDPNRRLVNGSWMDREEFEVCGWFVVRSYTTDDGRTLAYWKATLAGLRRYSKLIAGRRNERITAAQTRREADDEQGAYYTALLDAKPEYPK